MASIDIIQATKVAVARKRKSKTSDNAMPEAQFLTRRVGLVVVVASLLCGAVSFPILFGLTPLQPTGAVGTITLLVNAVLVASLIGMIGWELYVLLVARKRRRAAARLHIRIVGLFSMVAAIPAILVAIIATVTLDIGLDRWFEERTKTIVSSSVSVAQAYMNESIRGIQSTTVSMAIELDNARQIYNLDRTGFNNLVTLQARGRGLLGASFLRPNGSIILTAKLPDEDKLPPAHDEAITEALKGDVVLIPPGGNNNLVAALVKLRKIPDVILYTIRPVDPAVMNSLREMEENTLEYRGLESNRVTVQLAFALLYTGVCLIILLSAIWMGISVADRIVSPIRRLITAADEVSSGNLQVKVPASKTEGDLRSLSDTFNNMISELKSQRDEIMTATEDIDHRRRFTEAVLSGVSAGVVGVDRKGTISICNSSAILLLSDDPDANLIGASMAKIAPEIWKVFPKASKSGKSHTYHQIKLIRGGQERNLSIQVTKEEQTSDDSFVVTIDDITNLVSAQRNSAWADVAQRIAHEIKNPLTPIQLSAERIRRRYGKVITDDREVFDQCTDTIIRQVSDIGRMVDEFSAFARMPKPTMELRDLREVVREAIFLQDVANPHVSFNDELGDEPINVMIDSRLLSQAFTNIVKNAVEAIEAVPSSEMDTGLVTIRATMNARHTIIDVIDNGKGLPVEERQKLLEPYITTREKGTGLGLAIVRKVMEDHGGKIELLDAPNTASGGRGAMMRLFFLSHKAQSKISEQTRRKTVENSANSTDSAEPIAGDGGTVKKKGKQ